MLIKKYFHVKNNEIKNQKLKLFQQKVVNCLQLLVMILMIKIVF